jgi:hypothetical protein
MPGEPPAPEFEHFERVVVKSDAPRCKEFHGEAGTIIWLDSYYATLHPTLPDQWLYVVHMPNKSAWRTFFQSELESEGGFDPESTHLGKRPEISFDLVMEEDNPFMEGSYRLPGELWKVVIFTKDDVPGVQFQPSTWKRPTKWEREVMGMAVRFPKDAKMGRPELLRAMTSAFGFSEWFEVHGPDSMSLR